MNKLYTNANRDQAVRLVAALAAFNGMLALAAGAGVLSLLHRDVASIGERLTQHLHLNPAKNYQGVFLDALAHLDDAHVLAIAIGATAYAAFRLVMAAGLWGGRPWAEWVAATFLGNVLVVVLMVNAVVARRSSPSAQSGSTDRLL